MTKDKESIAEYKDELETKIEDIFIWTLGEAVVSEVTKTVRNNDPTK